MSQFRMIIWRLLDKDMEPCNVYLIKIYWVQYLLPLRIVQMHYAPFEGTIWIRIGFEVMINTRRFAYINMFFVGYRSASLDIRGITRGGCWKTVLQISLSFWIWIFFSSRGPDYCRLSLIQVATSLSREQNHEREIGCWLYCLCYHKLFDLLCSKVLIYYLIHTWCILSLGIIA